VKNCCSNLSIQALQIRRRRPARSPLLDDKAGLAALPVDLEVVRTCRQPRNAREKKQGRKSAGITIQGQHPPRPLLREEGLKRFRDVVREFFLHRQLASRQPRSVNTGKRGECLDLCSGSRRRFCAIDDQSRDGSARGKRQGSVRLATRSNAPVTNAAEPKRAPGASMTWRFSVRR
jgi:hypothetical protein